jgi:hypothetical protein
MYNGKTLDDIEMDRLKRAEDSRRRIEKHVIRSRKFRIAVYCAGFSGMLAISFLIMFALRFGVTYILFGIIPGMVLSFMILHVKSGILPGLIFGAVVTIAYLVSYLVLRNGGLGGPAGGDFALAVGIGQYMLLTSAIGTSAIMGGIIGYCVNTFENDTIVI